VQIDERTRHEMYLGLEEKLGTAVADALMAHLPPIGWADVATKRDLAELERRIDLRFDRFEDRLGSIEERMELRFERQDEHIDARIHAEINRLLLFLFPGMLSGLGLAVAIGKLV
jgi:hypothetical protein